MKSTTKNTMSQKIETIKTIIITALVAGIAAFIAGNIYANSVHNQVKAEAVNIVKEVKVKTVKE